jgi:hypothetical protein
VNQPKVIPRRVSGEPDARGRKTQADPGTCIPESASGGRVLRWGSNIPDGGRGAGDVGSVALRHGQSDRNRDARV